MDKLTLQVLSDTNNRGQQLYDYLFNHIDLAPHNGSVELSGCKGYSEIHLHRPLPQSGQLLGDKRVWLEAVSAVLSDYILDHREEELLFRIIRQNPEYSATDAGEVLNYCRQLMDEEDDPALTKKEHHGRERRRKLLSLDLCACLTEQPYVNLEGVLRFRTPKYRSELREVIEYASDEFLMDRQYKEFIALLRYFVYIQDSKIPAAHLMHKGGHEFILLNEQMKPIDTEQLDTTFKVEFLDKDYNLEDLIVSTLITIAPERIYIHTREPELPVIRTISQIFEERSEICTCCRACMPFLGDLGQQDKLSP